jgi:uncharacterized protein YkwD
MKKRRWLGMATAGILAAALLSCTQELNGGSTSSTPAGPPAGQPGLAADVVVRVNDIRVEAGLGALAENATLAGVASAYSCAMAAGGFFSHADPDGLEVDDRVKAAGIVYRQVGENLARNSNAGDPVDVAVQGWLESESHRENMLRPGFTETGAGVCRTGDTYYFTQLFLQAQ